MENNQNKRILKSDFQRVVLGKTDNENTSSVAKSEGAVTSTASEQNNTPKPTVFDLYNAFYQATPCANIGGELHLLTPQGYYVPANKNQIIETLYSHFYGMIVASGSTAIVKKCAELIMSRKPYEVVAAEKQNFLCLQNGYLPLNDLENTCFQAYGSTSYVFPTYSINASGYAEMSNWGLMKTLPTAQMGTFLATIANGNADVITRIWQMLGYLLTPDTNGKCFFLLQGVPNSGKSVLGNLIKALLPSHRIASLDIDQLGKKGATKELVDKSINISMDLPNKTLSPLAIRNIKLITGNDDLTVENKDGTYEIYHGGCKFVFATNHPLTLRGSDPGLEERIVCIPFQYSVPAGFRNYNLVTALLREKDNIVAKAISYYKDLRNSNYVFAGADLDVCKAKIRYLPVEAEDTDASVCQFVEERCMFVPMDHGTFTQELYNAYLSFCSECSYTPINTAASFSRRLNKCYGDRLRKDRWRECDDEDEKNQNGFLGIVLQSAPAQRVGDVWNV